MKPHSPSHEDIARRAREIWTARGNPSGYDIGHWLEAERELTVAAITALRAADQSPATVATTPGPDELAAKAASQKQAARSPQLQHGHPPPKWAPTESGKPLWDKPHSS